MVMHFIRNLFKERC